MSSLSYEDRIDRLINMLEGALDGAVVMTGTVVMDDWGRYWYSEEYWHDPAFVIRVRSSEWLCVTDLPRNLNHRINAMLEETLPAGLPQSCGEHSLYDKV